MRYNVCILGHLYISYIQYYQISFWKGNRILISRGFTASQGQAVLANSIKKMSCILTMIHSGFTYRRTHYGDQNS